MPTSFSNSVGIISTFAKRAVLAHAKANAIAHEERATESEIKLPLRTTHAIETEA
jgi:hypothetical protein